MCCKPCPTAPATPSCLALLCQPEFKSPSTPRALAVFCFRAVSTPTSCALRAIPPYLRCCTLPTHLALTAATHA